MFGSICACKKPFIVLAVLIGLPSAFTTSSEASTPVFKPDDENVLWEAMVAGDRPEWIGDYSQTQYSFYPFARHNRLKLLKEKLPFTIASNHPKLDGATSALPIYAAFVEMFYENLDLPSYASREEKFYDGFDEKSLSHYFSNSTTSGAYQRLIDRECDIFFGLQPSQEQLKMVADKGAKFVMTPIAKDAFVFIINKGNPVNSLTIPQIQDIYQKNIASWDVVGGEKQRILPFQRQEGSGSQTAMLAEVMKGKPLAEPLVEEIPRGMGWMVQQVATYRNYASAIGYSFFSYVSIMHPDPNIKFLAINGVEPTPENIRSGAYPFTVDVYAITTGNESENTKKILNWLVSEQGQRFIEGTGYVGISIQK